jgi:exosome complex RNA-binding protein Csl4
MLSSLAYDSATGTNYSSSSTTSGEFISAPHGLAFLTQTGEVIVADWSNQVRETPDVGAIIIGRVQLSRSRNTQLNRAEVEGFKDGNVYVVPSYDGRNLAAPSALISITASGDYRDFGAFVDCKNFNLIVQGTFDLSTIILEAMPTGSI